MNSVNMSIVITIVGSIVGLLALYAVIEAAVKNGINSSIIGQFLEKKNGIEVNKKSFLDDDLDNKNESQSSTKDHLKSSYLKRWLFLLDCSVKRSC